VLLGSGLSLAVPPAARADQGAEADASAEYGRVVMMQRYIVSATRIDKNPWRYASFPGFEILSRADDDATAWWIDANRRGWWFENEVMPKDWLPQSPVPYTLIIDDTNLETVPIGEFHSQPITFRSPADALTWGELSGRTRVWHGLFGATTTIPLRPTRTSIKLIPESRRMAQSVWSACFVARRRFLSG